MKKIILFALMISFAMNAYGQANVIKTTNFKFRTIKRGYTGNWIGSQTDTTGNDGLNYNALMDEILWSTIFSSSYSIVPAFRDSIIKSTDTLVYGTAAVRAQKMVNDTTKWNTVSQSVGTDSTTWNTAATRAGKLVADSTTWNTAATRAGKLVADSTKWNSAVPTYKELIGFITQTGTSAPSVAVISSTYVNAPTFTYQGIGNYQCLTGAFEAELTYNTIIMIQPATDPGKPPIRPKVYASSNYDQNGTYLYIMTYDTLNAVHNNQLLYGSTILIRSYP